MKVFLRILALMSLGMAATQVAAHTFFVGNTEILANEHTKSIEVIHRFTSHDLEALLSDRHQLRIDADSDEYRQLIAGYIAKNFSLTDKTGNKLNLELVGIEPGVNDTHIYQEVIGKTSLEGMTIYHRLLTDYFPNQKNRVNYESLESKGSLLFDNNRNTATIKK